MTALEPQQEDTTIDLRTLSVQGGTAVPDADRRPGGRPDDQVRTAPTRPGSFDDSDAHLLRLCLDLQLDALMLTLGAASAQQARDETHAGGTHGALPWRRWVEEDVDTAAMLAADTLAGGATLPSTLGTETDHAVPAVVLDFLEARYVSMRDLLTDLLARDRTGPDGGRDAWRPRVRDALHRCQTRLVELREYRISSTPPRGLDLGVPAPAAGSPLAAEHEYLPGELLG